MSRRRKPVASERSERGAAAVEFGLISIALLTLLIGIIQFAIWFWAFQVGSHAAREGARQYAVHPCDDQTALVQSRVGPAADGPVTVSSPTFTNGNGLDPGTTEVGDSVTVTVSFSAHEIGIFTLPVIAKSATARVEYIPAGGC